MKRYCFLASFLVVAISGCGSDSASYMVDANSDTAFSLFRDKSLPGADWQLEVVLTHLPDCQRRHKLNTASSDKPYRAALFLNPEGYYVLHSADSWYQAQLVGCTLKPIASAPASPGDIVGSWEEGNEGFKFFPAGK